MAKENHRARVHPGSPPRRRGMTVIGEAITRVDGPAKVTGAAKYAAEFDVPHVAYAVLVTSTIPNGRIVQMQTAAAQRSEGVLAVMTPANAPRLPQGWQGCCASTCRPRSLAVAGRRSALQQPADCGGGRGEPQPRAVRGFAGEGALPESAGAVGLPGWFCRMRIPEGMARIRRILTPATSPRAWRRGR